MQLISLFLSSGLGVVISLWENSQDRKSRDKNAHKDRELQDKISERKQVSEFRDLEAKINVTPTKSKKKFVFKIWSKEFGWESEVDELEPVISPAQHFNNVATGMLVLTYCGVVWLFAYNAQRIIWSFSPSDATDHWTIFFGLASHSVSNPQILEVSCGGIAVYLPNPIATIITRRLTGVVLSGKQ